MYPLIGKYTLSYTNYILCQSQTEPILPASIFIFDG